MQTSDFDFELPPAAIAQNPAVPRDHSRLMVLNRGAHSIAHHRFYDLPELLRDDDVLVINDTRVLPARLYGKVDTQGKVEVLLLDKLADDSYRVMAKPGAKLTMGRVLSFDEGLSAEVITIEDDGCRILKFSKAGNELETLINQIGHVPVPPYIKNSQAGREQYQTVYAQGESLSSAAPTAGLHFTAELLDKLRDGGIDVEQVTLHVGRGTFQGVKTDTIEEHVMHNEVFELNEDTVARLDEAKANGRRIVAVGTTSVRVLESCANNGRLEAASASTGIFIYPGYTWQYVDAMITNFHLPRSTLLMLVSSFTGREFALESYEAALKEGYRFFSFGDAMLIE